MIEWIKTLFDGIGTQVLFLIIGVLSGGTGGFCLGRHRMKIKMIQKQKAGSNSEQVQIGYQRMSETEDQDFSCGFVKSGLSQRQEAGEHAIQTQIGGQDGK